MFSCVLTAVIGMLTVAWYSIMGGQISEEETEHEVREAIDKKAKRGKFFGLIKPTAWETNPISLAFHLKMLGDSSNAFLLL